MTRHAGLRQVARLVKIGVPFREAWEMNPAMRLAWLVVDGENEGREFDWAELAWRKP